MKKLMVLGVSMTAMLAACGGDADSLKGNSYTMEVDGEFAGTFDFGEDGKFSVDDGMETVGESYEITDDEFRVTMTTPFNDNVLNLAFSYDDLSADVIEGEVLGYTLENDDMTEEAIEEQEQMNEEIAGTPYTLTKVEE